MSVSFSFSKRAPTRIVSHSVLRDDSTKESGEKRDFVTSIEGEQLKGSGGRGFDENGHKELVIPLINKNNWRAPSPGAREDINTSTSNGDHGGRGPSQAKKRRIEEVVVKTEGGQDDLTSQAVKELLEAAGEADTGVKREVGHIPLLLQNKIPNGFEEDDNMDVSLRPDMSTLEDYERIPIEEFGMAMLRGMGWSKEEGIGLTNRRYVEMMEPMPRARGLGLGAEKLSSTYNDPPPTEGGKSKEVIRAELKEYGLVRATKESDKEKKRYSEESHNGNKGLSRKDDGYRDSRDSSRKRDKRDRDYSKDSKDSRDYRHHHKKSKSKYRD